MRIPKYLFLSAGALLLAACGQTTAPITPGTTAQAVTERCSDNPQNLFKNCGFETGDFTGWVTQDLNEPLTSLAVTSRRPSEGDFAVTNGFDGAGPGHIKVCQDITVPLGKPLLSFDYQASWHNSGTKDRVFRVTVSKDEIETFSYTVLTAKAGTNGSTEVLNGSVDLSDVAGTTGRLCFDWEVPEDFTGPASAMLDNVNLTGAAPLPPTTDSYTINAEGVSSKNILYGVRVGQGMSGPAHSGRVSVGGKRVIGGKFRGGQSAKVLDVWGGKRLAVVANAKSNTLNPGGGQLQFVFNPFFTGELVTVKEMTLYNVVKPEVTINLYQGRKLVKQVPVPTGAAGAPVTVSINEPGISIVSVTARFPIAVDDLVFEVPQR